MPPKFWDLDTPWDLVRYGVHLKAWPLFRWISQLMSISALPHIGHLGIKMQAFK